MKRFVDLCKGSVAERESQGTLYTVAEILQQPDCLSLMLAGLKGRWKELAALDKSRIAFFGAGSSAFIGDALVPVALFKGFDARSIPTTDAVSHPSVWLGRKGELFVSFARSGNSPESLATVELANRLQETNRHVAITCNASGELAASLSTKSGAVILKMPPATNDLSLAMTSSLSAMYAAGLAMLYADTPDAYQTMLALAARVMEDTLTRFGERVYAVAARGFSRAQYLGSGVNFGIARETRLKMQEMTEGRVVAQSESYLGLRHGPQVFVNDACLVVAYLSTDRRARAYEIELLKELRQKKQGLYVLAVCGNDVGGKLAGVVDEVFEADPDDVLSAEAKRLGLLPIEVDHFLALSHLAVGQEIATVASLEHGLKPDSPSASGIINRVVQGVTIQSWDEGKDDGHAK